LIELKNTSPLRKSIDAISAFISEGNFRFNEQGIHFKAIDPSQILLVNLFMDKKHFDSFSVEPTFVGVDLVELSKIMARSLPTDKLRIDLTDSEMKVKLEGDFHRSFKLPLIDVSEDEINLPSKTYDASIEISARIMKEALKDASLFGSSVIFKVKGSQFFVEARGSQGTLDAVSKETKGIKVKASKDVTAKFSLNFLQNIIKEADAEEKILLELKTDAPMKVSYNIGKNRIEFFLAHMLL